VRANQGADGRLVGTGEAGILPAQPTTGGHTALSTVADWGNKSPNEWDVKKRELTDRWAGMALAGADPKWVESG
jgi:hypothetical protein